MTELPCGDDTHAVVVRLMTRAKNHHRVVVVVVVFPMPIETPKPRPTTAFSPNKISERYCKGNLRSFKSKKRCVDFLIDGGALHPPQRSAFNVYKVLFFLSRTMVCRVVAFSIFLTRIGFLHCLPRRATNFRGQPGNSSCHYPIRDYLACTCSGGCHENNRESRLEVETSGL